MSVTLAFHRKRFIWWMAIATVIINCVGGGYATFAEESQQNDGWVAVYTGTIGSQPVHFTFQTADSNMKLIDRTLKGRYFYDRFLNPIPIEGKSSGPNVTLKELDAHHKVTAVIDGTFQTTDKDQKSRGELGDDILIGTWKNSGGAEILPVKLQIDHGSAGTLGNPYMSAGVQDSEVKQLEANALKFKRAVIANNRSVVADCISYSYSQLEVNRKRIKSKSEFLKNYDKILTPRVVAIVKSCVPRDMFAKSGGIMMDDTGSIWLDSQGKVFTLR